MRKKTMSYLAIATSFLLISFYNNCAPNHIGSELASFSSFDKSEFENCEKIKKKDLFVDTYFGFLKNNCITCHTPTGEGKGSFSDENANTAYNSFALIGEGRVAEFSMNSGHNPPYSGSQHIPIVTVLTKDWKEGLEFISACEKKLFEDNVDDQYKDKRIHLKSKSINPTIGSISTVTWDFDTDLIKSSALNLPETFNFQANFSIQVEVKQTETSVFYKISGPEISLGAGDSDLLIKSLRLKINGQIIPNVTTFMDINVEIPKGATQMLSNGGVLIDSEVRGSDVISVTFGEIESTTIIPPPPGPNLSFVNTSISIAEQDIEITNNTSSGAPVIATLTVKIDKPTDDISYSGSIYENKWVFINYAIDEMNSTAEPKCCTRIDSKDFNFIDIERYDWDYDLLTSNTLVIQPGQTQASIDILIARDSRSRDANTLRYNRVAQEYIDQANGDVVIQNSEDFPSVVPAGSEYDENGETIIVKISSYSVGSVIQALPASDTATITITDTDTIIPGIPFSFLMEPGGVFRNECLKCHNPVDHRQGYSLTEFDTLIDRGIIIPSKPNDSMFFIRMDAANSQVIGLNSMPLDDFLESDLVSIVRQWINGGAPNN